MLSTTLCNVLEIKGKKSAGKVEIDMLGVATLRLPFTDYKEV